MDAQLLTVQKLEEKERALQGSLGGVEKELTLRSQALELNKRKVRPGPRGESSLRWRLTAEALLGPGSQPSSCLDGLPGSYRAPVPALSLISGRLHFGLRTVVRRCVLLLAFLSEETEA